jgi:hypothetical protein
MVTTSRFPALLKRVFTFNALPSLGSNVCKKPAFSLTLRRAFFYPIRKSNLRHDDD